MADANEETTTDTTKADSKSEDLIPRSEAQKAFKARDEAKAALRALEGTVRKVPQAGRGRREGRRGPETQGRRV
jgi:hypothetical protein